MESFFGAQPSKKTGTGPIVSKVFVKTAPKPKVPIGGSRVINGNSSTKSGSTSVVSRPQSSKLNSLNRSSSHSNGKKLHSRPSSSTPTSTGASPRPNVKRKISQIDRIESESESDSSSDSGDDESGIGSSSSLDKSNRKSKRKRTGNELLNGLGGTPTDRGDEKLERAVFCPSLVDERGEWGRGWSGFVPAEDVVRGYRKGWAGVMGEGERAMLDKYVAWFEKAEPLPFVELQYPAPGCRERFPLLTPTSREFAPLRELRTALQIILEFYIPPSHQHIFGNLSDSLVDLELPPPSASRLQSPAPGGLNTPPPDSAASPVPANANNLNETIADAIRKALAPNRRDGPGLLKAMEKFNNAMEDIQKDGSMAKWLATRGPIMTQRDFARIVDVVHDQAYARVVGPYSNELEHHPKHPEDVLRAITAKEDAYGELRHTFMSKVIQQTGLNPKSTFVDLGSGVGNCVMQVALQAGCPSYGFELLPVPAHCARLQLRETQRRWSMWCLNGNLDVQVHEGDFRVHDQVAKRLREADVVLVNNEVFPSSLNRELTDMFLDLKEGAQIVSLKPFVPEGFRMNDLNCDSFAAIVKLHTHTYHRDWVSWKGDSGKYYIQVIDRSMRIKYEEELNGGRRRR